MDEQPEIDSSLLDRAKRGSCDAQMRLVYMAEKRCEAYIGPRIPREFRSLISQEDIVQIASIRALKQFHKIKTDSPYVFHTWFQRIAENTLQSEVRALRAKKRGGDRKRVHEGEASAFHMDELSGKTPTPRQRVERKEIVSVVKTNLAGLPSTQRKAIRLYHIENYSIAQTAAILGKPPGLVRGIIARGLKTLKQAFGNSTKWFSR